MLTFNKVGGTGIRRAILKVLNSAGSEVVVGQQTANSSGTLFKTGQNVLDSGGNVHNVS